ncbi:S-layer homology domain-containing protein [Kamptonema formosum]|uniref:S-layer homology domain-containing protein n=1 Tax=Kamptonema formosum TaxID=331992 RepID=UPI000348320B|nr:S-layer homology domain-containing protein [Oscillatoria sp. PCC 10802]
MRQVASIVCLTAFVHFFPVAVQAQQPIASIDRVVGAGLMSYFPDGQFHPERVLTRAELAAVLVKTFKLDKRKTAQEQSLILVSDVSNSHWAYNDIQVVLKTGVMNSYRDGLFFPDRKITRAEAFAIFAQAYGVFQLPEETIASILAKYRDSDEIPDWAQKPMATALSEGFVNVETNKNLINPLEPMRRQDMVYSLSKYLERQQKPADISNPIQ